MKYEIRAQRTELTEYLVYSYFANNLSGKNSKVLKHIAEDEKRHYEFWKTKTNKETKPFFFKKVLYISLGRILGLSFALKLMERDEHRSAKFYEERNVDPQVARMMKEEHEHEEKLLSMLKEDRLDYAGAIVLGLNDALVELTGALAGLSFALQNTKLVGITGIITGFAASLSMAASGYLSSKEESDQNEVKSPLKAAIYTGVAYILTVVVLVSPYFIFQNIFYALATTLASAVIIIFLFNFYIAIAKSSSLWKSFLQMAVISLGVAALSFGVGMLLRFYFGIEV